MDIESVEDVLLVLQGLRPRRGGQRFVVCTPFHDLTSQILQHCIAASAKKKAALISFSSQPGEAFAKHLHLHVDLSTATSITKAVQACKRSLHKVSKASLVFVELAGQMPDALVDEKKQHELLKSLEKFFAEKSFTVAWFIRRDAICSELLISLKDSADFFLDVRRVGALNVAQFLTAKGVYSPEMFLPKTLSVSANSISLSRPPIPSFVTSSASSQAESQLGEPAVNFLEKEYKQAFDHAAEGMMLFELWGLRPRRGDYKEFNERAKDALGYDESELTTLKLSDLVVPEKLFRTIRSLHLLKKKGKFTFATEVKRKSGRTIDVEVSASSLGKNTYVAICTDISCRVKAERDARSLENEYQSFVSSLPYPYAIFVNRKLALKNTAFDSLFPWIKETGPSVSDFFGRRNPELLKEISMMLDEPTSHIVIQNREVLVPALERQTVATEVSISRIQYEGKQSLYCTFVDVSERRQTLDKAEQTEEKFKTLLEKSLDAISISQDEKFILLNSSFVEMFGYSSAMELLGKEITTVISGRNARAEILEGEKKRVEGKEAPSRYEYTGVKKDGSKITVVVQSTRIKLDGKWAILAYHRDVTMQKNAEENVARKTKGLEVLNRISDEVSGATSLEDIYHHGMNTAIRGTQFEVGAVFAVDRIHSTMNIRQHRSLSENILAKLGTQSLDDGFARFFDKTHEPIVASIADYPPYLHYKSLFEAEQYKTVAFLPLVVKGMLYGVLMLATTKERSLDDNDRTLLASLARQLSIAVEKAMLAEQARDAEERFHATVQNISDVLYRLQPNGTFEYVSPNVEKLVGYKPSDFITNAGLWRALIHPDDRANLSMRISNQARSINEFQLEYRIQPKGRATYIWLQDAVRYKRDTNGVVVVINGIIRDITDRKKLAEMNIDGTLETKSAGSKTDVVHSLPDGIALFDNELNCVEWNTALEKITGVAHADVMGKNINDLPLLREELRDMIERSLENESEVVEITEFAIPHTDQMGELHVRVLPWRPLAESSLRPQADSGERVGTIALMTNVTGLRKLEREVSESEETLRKVVDAMGDALMISDLQGQVWEGNREFTRLTGYSRGEVHLTKFPYPWLMDEEMARFIRWIAELDEKQHLHDLDMTWQHKDGHQFAVSLNTTILKNALGDPMAILNIARDISERRKLSLELEWKNKQFELLNKIISHANTTTDLDQIFETIATEVHSLVPYEGMSIAFLDDAQQLSPWYLAVPTDSGESQRVDHLAVDARVIYDAVSSGKAVITSGDSPEVSEGKSQITIPLYVNEKALGAFSLIHSRPKAFSGDELSFLQPVADQIGAIIQRVRLFQQVSDDSKYIHNLLNSINNVVYTVDSSYRITEVNKAWREFMIRQGMENWANEEKIIGQSLQVIIPDTELWNHYKRVMDDLFSRRIEYYSRDFEIPHETNETAYHLVINPMVINNKVTALVFTHTDITEINRTEAEIKRRNKELIALNAIATSINKSLELESVLRVAAEQLKEAFDATGVAFYLVDEERQKLVLSHHLGIPEELAATISILDIEKSLTGQVIATRKPMFITDDVSSADRLTEMGRRMNVALGLQSSGVVPLQSKDKVQGAFMINYSKPHAFTEKEQQLLLLIGNQISAALENAQLYAEVQRQVKTLTTLYELGKGLTGVLDLKTMLQVVYREVSKALPLERFYYQAYLPEQNTLSLLSRTVNGVAEFYPAGVKVRSLQDWPNTIYQEVVANGTSYMGGTSGDTLDSMIAVPIKSEERVIGIISIVSSAPNLYKDVHLRLLESIANLTGVAIGKATLYEDTLKKSSEIENRNKELDDFTYVVSHDLKEPLISIEGYSKIVMKDYKDRLDEEGKQYLSAVVQSTTRMKHLIDDLLMLSRLGRMDEAYESVSVGRIINEILHDFQFTLREKNVVVHVAEQLPKVRYSSTRLSMVFRNLISNAMKFNDKPNPTIGIGVRDEEDEYVFFVVDNGIGIEPQYFDRIFTIFQRLKRSEEYRGTGAGLTIVKKIVEREGGRIWVESAPGKGSTFYFTIKKPV